MTNDDMMALMDSLIYKCDRICQNLPMLVCVQLRWELGVGGSGLGVGGWGRGWRVKPPQMLGNQKAKMFDVYFVDVA